MTKKQAEYEKELKRIKRFIKNAEKRGYFFGDIIPKRPARITQKAIEDLKYLTTERLYAKGKYIDKTTGEVLSGTEGRKLERQKAYARGVAAKADRNRLPIKSEKNREAKSQLIIDNFKETLGRFPNAAGAKYLLNWLNELVNTYGKDAVADMLSEAVRNGVIISTIDLYEETKTLDYILKVRNYLPDNDIINDEMWEKLREQAEVDENWSLGVE